MRVSTAAEPPVTPTESTPAEPRCAQCGERLARDPLLRPYAGAHPLCAECACDELPHTD